MSATREFVISKCLDEQRAARACGELYRIGARLSRGFCPLPFDAVMGATLLLFLYLFAFKASLLEMERWQEHVAAALFAASTTAWFGLVDRDVPVPYLVCSVC